MFFKKSMALSVCLVFSCVGMDTASQGAASQASVFQSSMSEQSIFKDVGSQALNHSVIVHDLAQRVAQASLMTSRMTKGSVLADDFSRAQEDIKALRRGFCPHENNTLTQGSSPRVLAAVDCVLAQASTTLVDGERKFAELLKPSSLLPSDKKILFTAQILSFKHLMNSLFASVDRNGRYCGDEPRIATKHVVTCDADGSLLVGIEALECFSQATDDNASLCASCKNCSQELWCSDCTSVDRALSRIMPHVRNVARETESRVGVDDALWYLESRLGSTSAAIDAYATEVKSPIWQGSVRARAFADTRKLFLQVAAVQKEIIEGIAKMSDEQLCVETVLPLLENAPSSIGLAESAVKNMQSYNPLRFLPAKIFCVAALGNAAQELDDATKDLPAGTTLADIARLVREGTKTSLGITERELPLLCQMTHVFSRPLNVLIKDGVVCLRESAADVDRFALLYKKPLREQVLSPACRKQFEVLAHAWKTGGIDMSGLRLIKVLPCKSDTNEQKEG